MKTLPPHTVTLTWLRWLCFLCFLTIIVPAMILITCTVLMRVNTGVGWQRYQLPGIFLLIYIVAGATSPLMGGVALIILWVKKKAFRGGIGRAERRLKNFILILGIANILAIAFWALKFPLVFFSVGGSR